MAGYFLGYEGICLTPAKGGKLDAEKLVHYPERKEQQNVSRHAISPSPI